VHTKRHSTLFPKCVGITNPLGRSCSFKEPIVTQIAELLMASRISEVPFVACSGEPSFADGAWNEARLETSKEVDATGRQVSTASYQGRERDLVTYLCSPS
jgi:hypothetical protein